MTTNLVINTNKKFVYCVPRGGLNDALNQIYKCYIYCLSFNRDLIINTNQDHASCFHDHFSNVFKFKEKHSIKIIDRVDDKIFEDLNHLDCFPTEMFNKFDKYFVVNSDKINNYVDNHTGIQLTFDFSKDYNQKVLFHDQSGGGDLSNNLIKHLTFEPSLAEEINKRIQDLPDQYFAIHIRDTDYKSIKLETFLASVKDEIGNENLLICSDNFKTTQKAKNFFKSSDVYTNEYVPDLDGNTLHHRKNYKFRNLNNVRVKMRFQYWDLITLARSKKLFFPKVKLINFPNMPDSTSGFSRLALYLNKNKYLVDNLLSI